MLHSEELADQLNRCAGGLTSIEEFEEWFALNSWNVHQQDDKHLIDAVFRVEYLFSSLNDGHLETSEVLRQFAEVATGVGAFQQKAMSPPANGYRLLPEPVAWQFSKSSEETLNFRSRAGLLAPEENMAIAGAVLEKQMLVRGERAWASS